jgi:hypothetical protein
VPVARLQGGVAVVAAAVEPAASIGVIGQPVGGRGFAHDPHLLRGDAVRAGPDLQGKGLGKVERRPAAAVHVIIQAVDLERVAFPTLHEGGPVDRSVVPIPAPVADYRAIPLIKGVVRDQPGFSSPAPGNEHPHRDHPNQPTSQTHSSSLPHIAYHARCAILGVQLVKSNPPGSRPIRSGGTAG